MGNYKNRIEINSKILLGKPVFKGTRIPLYVVLDMLSEGMAAKEIIKAYPDLDKDDIKAAALAEKISALMTEGYLAERAKRGKKSKFQKAMSKVADIEAADSDRL